MSIQTIEHTGSGAKFELHTYGANILSFKPVSSESEEDEGVEVLFKSRQSKSLPVRGGIPIQFPIISPYGPKADMPEGGYMQFNNFICDEDYKYDSKSDAATQVSLDSLSIGSGRGRGLWAAAEPGQVSYSADSTYNVKVSHSKLMATFTVKNVSSKRANTFPFQLLFQNYFKVHNDAAMDPSQCFVKGLDGYIKQDKVIDDVNEQSEEPVVLKTDAETHYFFDPKGHMKKDLDVLIGIGDDRILQLTASAKIDDVEVPVSCVVWNPHKKKAREMDDMGSNEYNEMISVQPGITERTMMPPGSVCVFQWTLKMITADTKDEATEWSR